MDTTVQFLVATTDFLTAIELGKVYPEINNSKEVIGKFVDEFQLPNNGIVTLEELETVLIDNLFTEAIPTSLRLHYWERKYFFVDAMKLAAANNDVEFLKEYREHFNLDFNLDLKNTLEDILHLLYNVVLDKNREILYFVNEIRFLANHGYLEKILPANLKISRNKMAYVREILRTKNWKMFSDISQNNFEILKLGQLSTEALNKNIFIGLLSSGDLENLKNPPKEISSLKGWKVDKKYYMELSCDFPLNLPNAEFVEYFKEEILELGTQPIQELLNNGRFIQYYEGFKAVFELFRPNSITLDINGRSTLITLSPRDESKIVELFGYEPLDYHNDYLSKYLDEETGYGSRLRIMEFIRLKGDPKKIRYHLNLYLKIYPDPILLRELETLDETNTMVY